MPWYALVRSKVACPRSSVIAVTSDSPPSFLLCLKRIFCPANGCSPCDSVAVKPLMYRSPAGERLRVNDKFVDLGRLEASEKDVAATYRSCFPNASSPPPQCAAHS